MQASQKSPTSATVQGFYRQPVQQIDPYNNCLYQVSNHIGSSGSQSQGSEISFQACPEQFFTLESTPAVDYIVCDSSSVVSVSSNMIPFSPRFSNSNVNGPHHSSDDTYGSPLNGSSVVEDDNKLMHALWVLRNELLGPESDIDDSGSFNGVVIQPSLFTRYDRILEMAKHMDLKQLLLASAEIVAEVDTIFFTDRNVAISAANALMDILEKRVSVSGEPLERLSAYMLEGLRARLLASGNIIYKKLKCKEPTSSELMSSMRVLYQICPYYKFAYVSSNAIIGEAMENENRIHIIDFQIAQGSQWMSFIQAVSHRPGGPPSIRITGVDDSQSAHARGGDLQLVGQRLAKLAESCGVPFEFHGTAISGCDVGLEHLQVRHGEALAVNFPYVLHHMPDESVSAANHRDRLLRLVKSLSPKVVTLVEQESNTNTSTFFQRFHETLDYYTAMFESIDAARTKDDRQRISAEENCLARDVVNILACEGPERVERHETFGKWRIRLTMAGFSQIPLGPSVNKGVVDILKEYSPNYATAAGHGAVYLGWKNRALAASSAWR